ncbi:MAG TPA: diaminopimelate epimerase [Ignavibacteria bacterium]|nr:diaminopimelate epimerase [Ignavibacteria bacterium]
MNKNFLKYSGAGNNFIIINNLTSGYRDKKSLVIDLAKNIENADIDGIIFIEESNNADYKMSYYNRDGTDDGLCGNGLRCTAKYISDNINSDLKNISIEALGKLFNAEILSDGLVLVEFPPPVIVNPNMRLIVNFENWFNEINCGYIDVGSPHIVIPISEISKLDKTIQSLDEIEISKLGKYFRYHKDLMPQGVNVNFINLLSAENSIVESRVYERGVEGETLASGTGSLSVAIFSYIKYNLDLPINIKTRSNQLLTVDFSFEIEKVKSMKLVGKAEPI